MFGFLIALPGGKKIRGGGGWGQSSRARRAVLHSFLAPCSGEGPCEPHAPASSFPGGTEKGRELQGFSFLAPFSCKDVQRAGGRSTLRGAQGAANSGGGGSLKPVQDGVLGSLPPTWQAPPSCPHTCWRCGRDATALPAVHGSCLEQGGLLLLSLHSTH